LNNYNRIQVKLHGFIRKYYTNELIKGIILFLSFGLLYLLFTLFIEYFLWLKPTARTILFWIFIVVEFSLLLKYIIIPIFHLIGFSKGISLTEASKIIGKYFTNIDDKLLNMLQLYNSNDDYSQDNELLLASIDQKAEALQPIPFHKAINFSNNRKYLKYLLIPVAIWGFTLLVGRQTVFSESYDRIIHHQQAYIPPAPFSFKITNLNLQVIEGSTFTLNIQTIGDIIPESPKIVFNTEEYFLRHQGVNNFSYNFEQLTSSTEFYIYTNNIRSKAYKITVLPTPKIQKIRMDIRYPKYVNKSNETIYDTGNITVPKGSKLTWSIQTKQTDSLHLKSTKQHSPFARSLTNDFDFTLSKNVHQSFMYSILASNKYLKDFEKLAFSIDVIQDEYPSLSIQTDIDSISHGEAQFIGQLSDDYGISKLQIVYYSTNNPKSKSIYSISIQQAVISDFYYIFPKQLTLISGHDYEFYFEVFDNDAITGPKSVKSKLFSYHKDTAIELQDKLLQEQNKGLHNLEETLKKHKENKLDLDKLKQDLLKKPKLEFNDTKKLHQILQRQSEYQQMMQRQKDNLERNLKERPQLTDPNLQVKKQDILQQLKESKDIEKEEKLLEELQKMADKLQKEELLDRIKKMSMNNKDKEKSLEQLLELTKRFYVEQKHEQIRQKINNLAKDEENLSKSDDNTKEKQDTLNKEFDALKKEIDDLQKENQALKEPMPIDPQKQEQESIKKDMQNASDELEKDNKSQATKKQKSAANKMKQMAQQMQMQMAAGQVEMIDEDIALLRSIIENLLVFSFKQEKLMTSLSDITPKHSNFSSILREQNNLTSYFEHIDDSLYTLALRQAKLSPSINKQVSNINYYLAETLLHYADNQLYKANSDQHYVMTAANDLALLLSSLLDNMQNPKMGMGKGKGKGKGQSFSLPDIIKGQGDMISKMKNGLDKGGTKPGEKPGEDGKKGKDPSSKGKSGSQSGNGNKQGDTESNSRELFEIYKQQAWLRHALETQLKNLNSTGLNSNANHVKKQMKELEYLLLERGITNEVLNKMLRIEHELLKLQEAAQQQGEEELRESQTGLQKQSKLSPKQIEFKNIYTKQNEILNREVLPLRAPYRTQVKMYFKTITQ